MVPTTTYLRPTTLCKPSPPSSSGKALTSWISLHSQVSLSLICHQLLRLIVVHLLVCQPTCSLSTLMWLMQRLVLQAATPSVYHVARALGRGCTTRRGMGWLIARSRKPTLGSCGHVVLDRVAMTTSSPWIALAPPSSTTTTTRT